MKTTIEQMATMEMHSKEWFNAAFEGVFASEEIKEAARRITFSFGIRGQADPAYIANTIVACLTHANNNKFEGVE